MNTILTFAVPFSRASSPRSLMPLSLFTAVFLVGLTGCATTEPLTAPEVTLTDVDLVEATLFESVLDVEVRFSNDNPEPLVLDGAVIRLELDGRSFGKAMTSERIEVPRLGSVVHHLELTLSHVAVATKIRGVLDRGTVDYAISGKAYAVTRSGRTKTLRIEKGGSIDLRGGGPVPDARPVQ